MGSFVILAVFVIIALALVSVLFLLRKNRRKAARADTKYQAFARRREIASHGTATVVRADGSVAGTGDTQVRVLLTLEVAPPGGKPYRTHAEWFVQRMALDNLRQGNQIAVRIDAEDKNIIYPAEEWAKYIPE